MTTYGRFNNWTDYNDRLRQLEAESGHSFYAVSLSRVIENERRRNVQPEPLPPIPIRNGSAALVSNFCIHAGCGNRFDGSVDVGRRGGFGVHYALRNDGQCTGGLAVIPTRVQRSEWLRDLPAHHDTLRTERQLRRGAPAGARGRAAANAHLGGAPAPAAAPFPAVNPANNAAAARLARGNHQAHAAVNVLPAIPVIGGYPPQAPAAGGAQAVMNPVIQVAGNQNIPARRAPNAANAANVGPAFAAGRASPGASPQRERANAHRRPQGQNRLAVRRLLANPYPFPRDVQAGQDAPDQQLPSVARVVFRLLDFQEAYSDAVEAELRAAAADL